MVPNEFYLLLIRKYLRLKLLFALKFNTLTERGSSRAPSSFTYRGAGPLSEPETKALAEVMEKYKGLLKLYVSIHSYGNYILYPWSFTAKSVEDRDIVVIKIIRNNFTRITCIY